jgi:GR25 family glycosyltransferase involved in LPS biosynthesis
MDALQNYDEKGYFKCSDQYRIEDMDSFKHRKNDCEYVNSVWTPEQYAAQESLSQTYKQILKDFLASKLEHIMIFEDDARARDFMNDEIDIPDDAEILAWGGATSSTQTDAKRFANTESFHFRRVSGKRTAWYFTAYEFTRSGATKLLEDFESVPAYTTDTIVRYTLDRSIAYHLIPMGFVQGGSSYLAREGVQMPLTREEAKTYNLQNIIKPKSNNSK